ncbi:MAG: hypothetical protein PVH26_11005, partial [Desulfosarcina sp.]
SASSFAVACSHPSRQAFQRKRLLIDPCTRLPIFQIAGDFSHPNTSTRNNVKKTKIGEKSRKTTKNRV